MFRVIEQCLLTTLYMHLLLSLDLPSRAVCLMRLCIAIPVSERNSMSQTAGTELGCAGERYDATFLATKYLDPNRHYCCHYIYTCLPRRSIHLVIYEDQG